MDPENRLRLADIDRRFWQKKWPQAEQQENRRFMDRFLNELQSKILSRENFKWQKENVQALGVWLETD